MSGASLRLSKFSTSGYQKDVIREPLLFMIGVRTEEKMAGLLKK